MRLLRLRDGLRWRLDRWRSRSRVFQGARWLYDARPRVVQLHGTKLRVGYHFSRAVVRALLDGRYETTELQLLELVLTKTDRVMELGTGIGFLAAFCARAIGNDAVITYEANPKLERHIRNTFRLNRVAPHLVMAAAGVTAGTGTFHLSRDFWASSTIPGGSRIRPVAIPVRSLNIEIARFRPTLLIVDIEGGEVELVPQADLRNVRAVIIELHPRITGADAARTVESALLRAGFTNKAGIDGGCMLFQRV